MSTIEDVPFVNKESTRSNLQVMFSRAGNGDLPKDHPGSALFQVVQIWEVALQVVCLSARPAGHETKRWLMPGSGVSPNGKQGKQSGVPLTFPSPC